MAITTMMTEAGKELHLKKLAEQSEDGNPFIREADATYLRFDSIAIQPRETDIIVVYKWRGEEVYRILENFVYGQDNSLLLGGIEGRMLVCLKV